RQHADDVAEFDDEIVVLRIAVVLGSAAAARINGDDAPPGRSGRQRRASSAKSATVRVMPGRQTTAKPGAPRVPYSRTCSRRPSCALTKTLAPASRAPRFG